MNLAYEITNDSDNITIRLPKQLINTQQLAKLLEYIDLESIKQSSLASEQDIDTIATEIKQAAWENVKHHFEKKALQIRSL